jgi:hypothetical protein
VGAADVAAYRRPRRPERAAEEVVHEAVDDDRVAGVRRVAGALDDDQLAAGELGHLVAPRGQRDGVLGALHHQHGAGDRAQQLAVVLRPVQRVHRGGDGGPVGVERVGDAVLDRLGRVRLDEHLVHEEGGEVEPVPLPVVDVELVPPLRVGDVGDEVRRVQPGVRPQRDARRDQDHREHALGVARREQRREAPTPGEADDRRALGPGGVEHGQRVTDEHLVGVALALGRATGAAVPARVEGDHPPVPGQRGDLPLPRA